MNCTGLTTAVVLSLAVACTAARAQAPQPAYFATADSSKIYFEECGTGQAMVLVHDGTTGAAGWDALWPQLCAKYHVLRYDRRGMGRSDSPKAPFSSTTDLGALLANRHISRATVVGASAGGALAIDYALKAPASVERLVLLGAVVNGLGYSDHFLQRERANLAPVARGDVEASATTQANDAHMLAPAHDSARRTLMAILRANPQNLRKRGDLELTPAVPAVARLGEIRVPTLILVGEFDIADVQAHAGAIELGIWGARREVMRDAGHLIQLDQPKALTDRLIAFMEEAPVVSVQPKRLRELVGQYTSPFVRGERGDFYLLHERLFAHFPGGRDIPLYPSSDSTFYTLARTRSQITFRRNKSGKIESADISARGRVLSANRIEGKH